MKLIKRVGLVLAVLIAAMFIFIKIATHNTKKHSPNDTVSYVQGDLTISINYCRPYKKGRQIFDSLVPYGVVWRTGANEPTTFTTTKNLKIAGKELKAGEYTLWTIPNENSWEVIWNSKMYDWGVHLNGETTREAEFDALKTVAGMNKREVPLEQFTISLVDNGILKMVLEWDNVSIAVPIAY